MSTNNNPDTTSGSRARILTACGLLFGLLLPATSHLCFGLQTAMTQPGPAKAFDPHPKDYAAVCKTVCDLTIWRITLYILKLNWCLPPAPPSMLRCARAQDVEQNHTSSDNIGGASPGNHPVPMLPRNLKLIMQRLVLKRKDESHGVPAPKRSARRSRILSGPHPV